jgi:hypothetical protein
MLVFALKFLRNLWKIRRDIRNNPKTKIGKIINVLLGDTVVPHTFFNYIFLNREKYEARAIPEEVLLHERTHARQIHSLDVLLVELLQILFWFNPLIYLTKKSIKLNHEFLADEAVLNQGAYTSDYQKILLAFASSANPEKNRPSLANAINYSSIKKRFTVMKTRTSKKSILLRSLLLVPLLAFLLYGFSTTVQIPEERKAESVPQQSATEEQLAEYNALAKKYFELPTGHVLLTRTIGPADELQRLTHLYNVMSAEQKANAEPFPMPDFAKPSESQKIYQEGATKKQIREYDRLAEKYNTMLAKKGNIRIKKSEVERLEYLYSIMTEAQRAEAEPFPDFPEPPAPPTPPTPPDHGEIEVEENIQVEVRKQENVREEVEENVQVAIEKREVQTKKVEVNKNAVQEIVENQEIYDHLGGKKYSETSDPPSEIGVEPEPLSPPAPQAPPAPKSPLGLMEIYRNDNVKIIVDGKEIGYAKAEKLFKESTFSLINIRKQEGQRPVMELTTER